MSCSIPAFCGAPTIPIHFSPEDQEHFGDSHDEKTWSRKHRSIDPPQFYQWYKPSFDIGGLYHFTLIYGLYHWFTSIKISLWHDHFTFPNFAGETPWWNHGETHAVPVTQQDTLKGPVHHMAEHHEGQEGLNWMWNLGFSQQKAGLTSTCLEEIWI